MSSDVRSLLRQQRAARRINHPHAVYSDAGKLLCSLCREQLKAESLWDTHLLSQSHKGHLQQQQQRKVSSVESSLPLDEPSNGRVAKRKLDSADTPEDVEMRDAARRKRSKSDLMTLAGSPPNGGDGKSEILALDQVPSAGSNNSKESTRTPPGLTRKLSTPSQGVELQIPSRPATPAYRDGGSTSSSGGYFGAQSQNGPSTPVAPRAPATTTAGAASTTSKADSAAAAPVDESEWAAFEADIAAATVPYDQGAVISVPAMTNEEAAAAAKEAEEAASAGRKLQVDVDIEAEKEEAERALEDEFDQMKGLEERVDKLKEMRAAFLKKRSESISRDRVQPPVLEVSNGVRDGVVDDDDDDDDDDEDEDEDEDDWDSFRFRR